MQKFEMPMVNVEEFEIVDVIMTSVDECLNYDEGGSALPPSFD